MALQLVINDSVVLENAASSLEAVRAVFEHEGRVEETHVLAGLEVLTPASAELALATLRSLHLSPATRDAVEWAQAACFGAVMSNRRVAA